MAPWRTTRPFGVSVLVATWDAGGANRQDEWGRGAGPGGEGRTDEGRGEVELEHVVHRVEQVVAVNCAHCRGVGPALG